MAAVGKAVRECLSSEARVCRMSGFGALFLDLSCLFVDSRCFSFFMFFMYFSCF